MIETIGMVAAIVIGLGQLYLIERGLAQMAQSSEERREENRTQTKLLADIGQGIRDQAQAAQAGLWAGEFVPPWDWRRGARLD